MRKIILICSLLISGLIAFGQADVGRAGAANRVLDQRLAAKKTFNPPIYDDTTQANIRNASNLLLDNIGTDSCGAQIVTRYPQAQWRRDCAPSKHWVRLIDENNIGSFIDSGSVGLVIIDSNHFAICNGANACDTFTTNFNYSSITFITDSSVRYCHLDSTGGTVTQVCDTQVVGRQPIIYLADNWIRLTNPNQFEFGSNSPYTSPGLFLNHNTYANTGYYTMNWNGQTVYDAPHQFSQQQSFQIGSGIASFLSSGNDVYGQTNSARLMIGYTADTVNVTPFIDGVVGSSIGYYIGTNGIMQHGSYGSYVDDNRAKTSMILLHQYDTTNQDAVTIVGAPSLGGTTPIFNGDLNDYRIATFGNNGNIRFYGYDSTTRNDGVLTKVLGTDADGNLLLGTASGSGIPLSDTADKWINNIYKRSDSVFYLKGINEVFSFIDSSGSGGATVAYDSLFQTSDTSFALQRNDLTRDTVVVAWSPGDKNEIHVESWSDLTIINGVVTTPKLADSAITSVKIISNTIDSSQIKLTGVTEGTYTNATIRVNDRGQITYAASGSGGGGGSVNDFRYFPFQVGVTTNAASAGDTYFLLPSSYATSKRIFVHREGKYQFDTTNSVASYQFIQHLDTVFVYPALSDSERVAVFAYPDSNWTVDVPPVPVGYDPDAAAFFAAAGITDNTQKDAVNQLVLDLKAASLWTKMKAIYPYVGGTSSTHSYNLKDPTLYQITWNGTVTHNSNGVTFDGATGYGNTGLNDNTVLTLNSVAIGGYSRTSTNNGFSLGVIGSTGDALYLADRNSAIIRLHDASDLSAAETPTRLIVTSRQTSAPLMAIYRDGVQLVTNTTAPANKANFNIYVGAINNIGSAAGFSDKNYALHFISDGLSASEVTALTTAVTTFETTLGRNL